jgi:hypothetical protein
VSPGCLTGGTVVVVVVTIRFVVDVTFGLVVDSITAVLSARALVDDGFHANAYAAAPTPPTTNKTVVVIQRRRRQPR